MPSKIVIQYSGSSTPEEQSVVTEYLNAGIDKVEGAVNEGVDVLGNAASSTANVVSNVAEKVVDGVVYSAHGVVDGTEYLVREVAGVGNNAANTLGELVVDGTNAVVKTTENVLKTSGKVITGAVDTASGLTGDAVEGTVSAVQGVSGDAVNAAQAVGKATKKAVNSAVDLGDNLVRETADVVTDTLEQSRDLVVDATNYTTEALGFTDDLEETPVETPVEETPVEERPVEEKKLVEPDDSEYLSTPTQQDGGILDFLTNLVGGTEETVDVKYSV